MSDVSTGAAPVLLDPAGRQIDVGDTLEIRLQVSDADGDTIAWSASGMPAGASHSASGTFRWLPGEGDTGVRTIRFEATDCTGRSSAQDVTVRAAAAVAPQLDSATPDAGGHRTMVTIAGRDLLGANVEVWFGSRSVTPQSITDMQLMEQAPKPPKARRPCRSGSSATAWPRPTR